MTQDSLRTWGCRSSEGTDLNTEADFHPGQDNQRAGTHFLHHLLLLQEAESLSYTISTREACLERLRTLWG